MIPLFDSTGIKGTKCHGGNRKPQSVALALQSLDQGEKSDVAGIFVRRAEIGDVQTEGHTKSICAQRLPASDDPLALIMR